MIKTLDKKSVAEGKYFYRFVTNEPTRWMKASARAAEGGKKKGNSRLAAIVNNSFSNSGNWSHNTYDTYRQMHGVIRSWHGWKETKKNYQSANGGGRGFMGLILSCFSCQMTRFAPSESWREINQIDIRNISTFNCAEMLSIIQKRRINRLLINKSIKFRKCNTKYIPTHHCNYSISIMCDTYEYVYNHVPLPMQCVAHMLTSFCPFAVRTMAHNYLAVFPRSQEQKPMRHNGSNLLKCWEPLEVLRHHRRR